MLTTTVVALDESDAERLLKDDLVALVWQTEKCGVGCSILLLSMSSQARRELARTRRKLILSRES